MKETKINLSFTVHVQEPMTPQVTDSNTQIIEIYKVVAARRTSRDNMVWQTVSIGLAAQAFLYGIAFSDKTAEIGKVVGFALSFVAAIVTLQLFAKQRFMEKKDSEYLEELECLIWPGKFKKNEDSKSFFPSWSCVKKNDFLAPHAPPNTNVEKCLLKRLYLMGSSYRLWCYCFWFIAILSFIFGLITSFIYFWFDYLAMGKQMPCL